MEIGKLSAESRRIIDRTHEPTPVKVESVHDGTRAVLEESGLSEADKQALDRHKRIIELRDTGESLGKIGAEVDISKSSVQNEIKKHEKKRCLCFASNV